MICVSLGRTRHKMVLAEHRALAGKGAPLVELRLDWLSHLPDLNRLIEDRPTPVIVTCRRREDRGRWRGTEEQRQTLLRSAIVAGVEYVDLEEDIAVSIPRYGETKRIISYHNFDETPTDLQAIATKLSKLDADIIKIVTMANTPGDVVRMLQLVKHASVPVAGFCMGEIGLPSRILCGRFGSPLTYCTFNADREMAPGQIQFEEMRDLYHYDRIGADTQILGVVGDPISHSLSPLIHNIALEQAGIDAVYIPFRIPQDTLPRSLTDLDWLGVHGFSVTIPHKEAARSVAQRESPTVHSTGAANTLVCGADGRWQSENTDYDAILESVLLGLSAGQDALDSLAGRKVILLGAGGAARAAATAMCDHGALVTIASRTRKRAQTLADEVGCQHCSWENRGAGEPEILINTTPVGMHPNVNESPFMANWMLENMLVFDTVYNPEQTLLVKDARERNCRVVTGIEMFVRQAARQFEMFTGQLCPVNQMRDSLRAAISPVGKPY
ncbi:MAG: shikimate dehydrogenase [Planctomycetaceae bacterium]